MDKIVAYIRNWWWAIVLAALLCWTGTLTYFYLFPPETALDKEVRMEADFLEPKQAADLAEARRLLEQANTYVRQLPRDVILYHDVVSLLNDIDQAKPGDEKELIDKAAVLLLLPEENQPKDLKDAAAQLTKRKQEIEQQNSAGFNAKLDALLAEVKKKPEQATLARVNEFLKNDVPAQAKERLVLRGVPAAPKLLSLLEKHPESNQGKEIYGVILKIIADTRLTSLNPTPDALKAQWDSTLKEFGAQPDAKAIAKIKEWLNSPGNQELLGKQ